MSYFPLMSYFTFNTKCYENNMLQQLMNFQFAIELSPNFKYLQIIYEKIILKFVIHSIAFARADINFPVVREITRIKKVIKTYNFRIKSGMCKMSIISDLVYNIKKSTCSFLWFRFSNSFVFFKQKQCR